MISTYKDIQNNVLALNEQLQSSCQVQKLFSSSYYISIQIRIPGRSLHLYIGRGHNREGLWIAGQPVPSELRKKDRLLEYLRKHISGCMLIEIEMDTDDRAFALHYQKWGQRCVLYFYYGGRELYFQNKYWEPKKEAFVYFQSWRGATDLDEMGFNDFDELGRKQLEDRQQESPPREASQLVNAELKEARGKLNSSRSEKFLKRKTQKIQGDLDRAKLWQELEKLVYEIDFSSVGEKWVYKDIKIKFKTDKDFARKDEVYKKIKKLKRAEEILQLRLADTQKKLSSQKTGMSKEQNKLKIIEPVWKMEKQATRAIVENNEYIVKTIEGLQFGIGKNARGNDQLRSKFASKEDWWFHLSDRPSGHIIVKQTPQPSPDVLNLVGAQFCAMENASEVDIVYTQVKNLKSVTGKPGAVRHKKRNSFAFNYS